MGEFKTIGGIRKAVFLSILFLFIGPFAWAQEKSNHVVSGHAPHKPGPHIVQIDYEALYNMKEPPSYKPFEVYGLFLMSVAA